MSETYAARMTFFANSSDLPAIQAEVKRYNMRFVGNPAAYVTKLTRLSVTVEADNMHDFNAGVSAINLITRPTPTACKPSPAYKLGFFHWFSRYWKSHRKSTNDGKYIW